MPAEFKIQDPTALTTEALRRDIGALDKLFSERIQCVEELIELKTQAITKLKEVKFEKVQQQFDLIDRARIEQKADTQVRLDIALSAQKEAAAKSEQSFTKQIDSIRDLMAGQAKSSDDKIAALTVRVSMREASGVGMTQLWGFIVGAIGLIGVLYTMLHK